MNATDEVDHVYLTSGNYTLTLTVTGDDGGANSMPQLVQVVSVEEAKHITNQYIQGLPNSAFKGRADNRKAVFANMFDALDKMLANDNYNGLIQNLRNNIRERADGYVDGKLNNDWIIDPAAQQEIC